MSISTFSTSIHQRVQLTAPSSSSRLATVGRHAVAGGALGAAAGAALSLTTLPFIGVLTAPIAAAIGGAAGLVIGGIVGLLRSRGGSDGARVGAGSIQLPPPPPTGGTGMLPPPPPPLPS